MFWDFFRAIRDGTGPIIKLNYKRHCLYHCMLYVLMTVVAMCHGTHKQHTHTHAHAHRPWSWMCCCNIDEGNPAIPGGREQWSLWATLMEMSPEIDQHQGNLSYVHTHMIIMCAHVVPLNNVCSAQRFVAGELMCCQVYHIQWSILYGHKKISHRVRGSWMGKNYLDPSPKHHKTFVWLSSTLQTAHPIVFSLIAVSLQHCINTLIIEKV